MSYGNYNPAFTGTGAFNQNDHEKALAQQAQAQQAAAAQQRQQEEWERQRQQFQEQILAQEQGRRNQESASQQELAERDMEFRHKKDPHAHLKQMSAINAINGPAFAAAAALGKPIGGSQSFSSGGGGGYSQRSPLSSILLG